MTYAISSRLRRRTSPTKAPFARRAALRACDAGLAVVALLALWGCGGGGAGGGSNPSNSGTTAQTNLVSQPVISPAFYVSPTGSDSNNGQSSATPFLTLEKAQGAMRASTTKTTYLLGGTYTRTSTLNLSASDAGEDWLAYPGHTPILDGAGTVQRAISIEGNDISIRWLTIQNFALMGIYARAVSGVLIDSNTIENISSTSWAQGGIVLSAGYTNGKVSHNLIRNIQYGGIVSATLPGMTGYTMTNLVIEGNAVYDTCISVADCGAIYAEDVNHTTTGVMISNNVISNYGSTAMNSKGIYLDYGLSNATIKNNIVRGTGKYGLQIYSGDHNDFQNNIFDISGAEMLAVYQDEASSTYPNFGMSNNTFTCNIVYSSSSPPSSLWDYAVVDPIDARPNDANNLYWDASGALPNTGRIVDAAPTVANPGFVDAAQANYNFQSGVPSFCGFSPVDTNQVGPLANP